METKVIWVVGCIRTGSSWVTQLLAPLVEKVYLEPEKYSPKEKDLKKRLELKKHTSFGFKWCRDKQHCAELIEMFPDSKFILTNRDGREIVHSIAFPSVNSKPVRSFPGVAVFAREKGISLFEAAIETWLGYMSNYSIPLSYGVRTLCVDHRELVLNFDREYKRIIKHVGFEGEVDMNSIQGPLRTPSFEIWKTWTEEQKGMFKNFPGANDMLINYGYVENSDW